ncbi:hypothetical protein [Ferruginibacter sp. SUN106]|uniref:hypothetical protein n=1 Tax=Ferruginibacter sp. SUN106 TaxID=2978348 RepID=UPI003D360F03
MSLYVRRWIKIALFNLFIVASIGVVLRYKIAFSLPFIDQKHLLHGHSHFAFAGWISQAIMILLVAYLATQRGETIYKRYRWLLYANLFTAYGMLITFPVEGYGLYSIIFSTLSIFVTYFFAVYYWRDLNKLKIKSTVLYWFKAAVFFNALSSLGAFALAAMMVAKIVHQNWYLAAEYFYLHFQYNGWFFFACMGLLTAKLSAHADLFILKRIFLLFVTAVVPAYFLSALWMNIPTWVYVLVIVAAFAQVIAWVYTLGVIKNQLPVLKSSMPPIAKWLLIFSATALTIKLLLQLGSTIPSLSNLAFGFRPIVIGYLHLVLLGMITLFLLGYMLAYNVITINKKTITGAIIFTSGIIINEIFLMTQGVAALTYTNIPFINEALLAAALIMFTGLLLLLVSQNKKRKSDLNHK